MAGTSTETGAALDPVIPVWHQWQEAQRLAERLGREQQHLEGQLARTVGFPCATFQLTCGERVTHHCLRSIREVLSFPDVDPAILAKAEADFAAHERRWEEADREIGYSAALQAERDAGDRADVLLETLAATPATSLAGIAAKLNAMLRESVSWDDGTEFPWPQVRSALDDLASLSQQLYPGQPFPWREDLPKPRQRAGGRVWDVVDGGAA